MRLSGAINQYPNLDLILRLLRDPWARSHLIITYDLKVEGDKENPTLKNSRR